MKFLKTAMIFVFVLFSFSALAADPIQDLIDVTVPVNATGGEPTLEEVKVAIIAGCRARGWSPSISADGKIVANILVRSKFYAEVEISYTKKTYSIVYKSSRELDYDEGKRKIHRNYNKWVGMLSASIQRAFGVRAQGF
jgi:hypothetical protein